MARTSWNLANVGIFSFGEGSTKPVPHYEFDLSHFRDPLNKDLLVGCKDGRDEKVKEWVKEDRRFPALLAECVLIAEDQRTNQGGRWLTIAFRDHHGTWKSPAVAELVADALAERGMSVCVLHDKLTLVPPISQVNK